MAERSAKAAKEITNLIATTTEKLNAAVKNMNKAGSLINEQKASLKITEAAFDKIQVTYN